MAYFGTDVTFEIPFPLVFQTRTFNNRSEIMQAVGDLGNIILGCSNLGITVGKGRAYWEYIQIFQKDANGITNSFTLYIFARFVN